MPTYKVVSPVLKWFESANSPEEAKVKFKRVASGQMLINRAGARPWVEPGVFREISRVLCGKFEVEETENL